MRGSLGGRSLAGESATATATATATSAPPTGAEQSEYKLIDLGTAVGVADEEEGGDQSMMAITDMEAWAIRTRPALHIYLGSSPISGLKDL
jgi:hypothetical protein